MPLALCHNVNHSASILTSGGVWDPWPPCAFIALLPCMLQTICTMTCVMLYELANFNFRQQFTCERTLVYIMCFFFSFFGGVLDVRLTPKFLIKKAFNLSAIGNVSKNINLSLPVYTFVYSKIVVSTSWRSEGWVHQPGPRPLGHWWFRHVREVREEGEAVRVTREREAPLPHLVSWEAFSRKWPLSQVTL